MLDRGTDTGTLTGRGTRKDSRPRSRNRESVRTPRGASVAESGMSHRRIPRAGVGIKW